MLDRFYAKLANFLRLSPLAVRKFLSRSPGSMVLAYGATKARRMDSDQDLTYEPGWITSRRGTLILTVDRLVCGDWEIPLDSIRRATLVRIREYLARGFVLKIATINGEHYQFGLQYDPSWETQEALPFQIEDGKLRYSKPSILIRIISWSIIAWLVITWGLNLIRALMK